MVQTIRRSLDPEGLTNPERLQPLQQAIARRQDSERHGIIGANGWLGSALVRHGLAGGVIAAEGLVLLNRSGPRDDLFGHQRLAWADSVEDLLSRTEIVVISVRPQDWTEIRFAAPDHLVISFMAGASLAELAEVSPRLARAMPNSAASTGMSFTPWTPGPELPRGDGARIEHLLSGFGQVARVSGEAHLAALTALSGSGAAYPALMARALMDFARAQGLPEDVARAAVENVLVEGGAYMAGQTDKAAALVETYKDYKGTTAAGLEAAEGRGFAEALADGLAASMAKAAERLI